QVADNVHARRFFYVQVINLAASLTNGRKDVLIDPRLHDSAVLLCRGPDIQEWKQRVRWKGLEAWADPLSFRNEHWNLRSILSRPKASNTSSFVRVPAKKEPQEFYEDDAEYRISKQKSIPEGLRPMFLEQVQKIPECHPLQIRDVQAID